MTTQSTRGKILAFARWGVRNAGAIHYSQFRPIDGIGHPRQLPLSTDCSGFVTICYNWAGAPDPNGLGYNGTGYTGTLLNHCAPITRAQAEPGDLVVFGPGSGHHVVIIVGEGGDPDVVSHGQEQGPLLLRLSAEAAHQPGPVRYLSERGLRLRSEGDAHEQVEVPTDLLTASNPPRGDVDATPGSTSARR